MVKYANIDMWWNSISSTSRHSIHCFPHLAASCQDNKQFSALLYRWFADSYILEFFDEYTNGLMNRWTLYKFQKKFALGVTVLAITMVTNVNMKLFVRKIPAVRMRSALLQTNKQIAYANLDS